MRYGWFWKLKYLLRCIYLLNCFSICFNEIRLVVNLFVILWIMFFKCFKYFDFNFVCFMVFLYGLDNFDCDFMLCFNMFCFNYFIKCFLI